MSTVSLDIQILSRILCFAGAVGCGAMAVKWWRDMKSRTIPREVLDGKKCYGPEIGGAGPMFVFLGICLLVATFVPW